MARAAAPNFVRFDEGQQSWTIGNQHIEAQFQLTSDGQFRYVSLKNLTTGHVWIPSADAPSAPFRLTLNGRSFDHRTKFRLLARESADIDREGLRETITLRAIDLPADLRLELEVYAGQPFLRYRSFYRNTGSSVDVITEADMLPWNIAVPGTVMGLFVGQWSWGGERANFEPHEVNLTELTGPAEAFTGAYGDHTTWGAARDAEDNGIVAGWEFNGRARAHAEHSSGILRLDAEIQRLAHRVNPGEEFLLPGAFLGLFQGDWDEAGYRTQRFVEAVLAVRLSDADRPRFPFVAYDTWGLQWSINETVVLEEARRAADLGVELFTIDFGWAAVTGDWKPDPVKFPNGLKPIADYVHSQGMKFGLHLPFGEAMEESEVLRAHPDWEVVPSPNQARGYFGAVGICLSHAPAREWVIQEIVRVVRENDVDWILQDGENMVKSCFSTRHTHHPDDSNYSNSVEGLDEVIRAVQEQLPTVLWENCEDGGNMQTFKMAQQYATSIVNDNADFLVTRKSVYGATYPFPPRYTDRYMEVTPWDSYRTRSHFFGGPLIIMDNIGGWLEAVYDFMKKEVQLYKQLRGHISQGKVYHLTPPPDGTFNDYLQSHVIETDKSVILVFRQETAFDHEVVYPRGLNDNRLYRVRFQDNPRSYTATGRQVAGEGIVVELADQFTAEVVYIDPAPSV